MKSTMRLILCILIVALLTSAFCLPALANSAIREWRGSTAHGVVASDGEQCPITVSHETLTFDIPHFPDGEFEKYAAKVTANYTLQNPTDSDVTVKLAFPFGQKPNYHYFDDEDLDSNAYGVSLNGQPIQTKLRHTYGNGDFDLQNDLTKLRDAYLQHDFYSPELPVTHYVYEITTANAGGVALSYAELVVEQHLGEKTKLFVPNGTVNDSSGRVRISVPIVSGGSRQQIDVYILGDLLSNMPEWSFGSYRFETSLEGEATLISQTPMTYYDLAMTKYAEDKNISELDWYNTITDSFIECEREFGVTSTSNGSLDISNLLMQWYEYEITVEAGKTVENSVTAPIFPHISGRYDPYIYSYHYLLSPATTWASFGTLDVIINTPYYLVNDTNNYESIERGYQKHFDSLPSGELSFTLSSSANPKADSPYAAMLFTFLGIIFGSFFVGVFAIAFVIFLIVLVLRAIIRLFRR